MNTLTIVVCVLLVAACSATPSGIWGGLGLGLGHAHSLSPIGPSGIVTGAGAVGPAGIVTGAGAAGPAGIVTGHGAVGPTGPNGHGAILAVPALGVGALGHGAWGLGAHGGLAGHGWW